MESPGVEMGAVTMENQKKNETKKSDKKKLKLNLEIQKLEVKAAPCEYRGGW
jgi:hypothetical protein